MFYLLGFYPVWFLLWVPSGSSARECLMFCVSLIMCTANPSQSGPKQLYFHVSSLTSDKLDLICVKYSSEEIYFGEKEQPGKGI